MGVAEVAVVSAAVLAFSVLLATLIEGAVEILAGKALEILLRGEPEESVRRAWASYGLQVFSILAGIGVVFTTNLDIIGYAAGTFGFQMVPVVSRCITGFIIGRGASYVHNIFGLVVSKKD